MAGRLVAGRPIHRMKGMGHSGEIEAYFELCKRIFERMERDGTWPWTADSTNPEDVIDSESSHDGL